MQKEKLFKRMENFLNSRSLNIFLKLVIIFSLISTLLQMLNFEEFNLLEFEHVSFSQLIAKGVMPYRNIRSEIGPIGSYGPLFYFTPGILGSIFGVANSPMYFLILCRLVVFVYIIGVVFLLYFINYQISRHKNFSLLMIIALISKPWFIISFRPDWMAFFYLLLAILILIKTNFSKKNVYYLIGFLLAISFLHYQRYMNLLVSLFIFLIFNQKIKEFFRLCVSFITFFILILFPFLIFSKGRIILYSFLVQYYLLELGKKFLPLFQSFNIRFLVLFVVAFYSYLISCFKAKSRLDIFVMIYASFCVFFTFLTLTQPGSAPNYFVEPVFVFGMMIATIIRDFRDMTLPEVKNFFFRKDYILNLIITLFLIFPLAKLFEEARYWRAEYLGIRGRYDLTVGYEKKLMPLFQGRMLTDSHTISYKTNHPEASNSYATYFGILRKKISFDFTFIKERIKNKFYNWLVFKDNSLMFDFFKNEIEQNYRIVDRIAFYNIYAPK